MKYAKLIEGEIRYAPKKIVDGEMTVYNPPAYMLTTLGYLPVVNVPCPEAPEGYYYKHSWAEQDGTIIDVWTLEKLPDDPSPEEIMEILLGGES